MLHSRSGSEQQAFWLCAAYSSKSIQIIHLAKDFEPAGIGTAEDCMDVPPKAAVFASAIVRSTVAALRSSRSDISSTKRATPIPSIRGTLCNPSRALVVSLRPCAKLAVSRIKAISGTFNSVQLRCDQDYDGKPWQRTLLGRLIHWFLIELQTRCANFQ